MPSALSAIVAKDGTPATIAGGILAIDKSGTGSGPFAPAHGLVDTQGVNTLTIKGASTPPAVTDTSAVVGAADGNIVTLGVTTGAAVITDASGTLQQYLRGLVKLLAAGISVAISNVNTNGLALPASAAPVVVAPQTTRVAVTPTVTASAYTAGNGLGGIMTFASIVPSVGTNGILQSIAAKFKASAVVGTLEVVIFKANPSNGTYTDKTAPTWNAADAANLLGIYSLATPNSKLGTMTVYNLDGIGAAFVSASTSLFAVVIVDGTPTPASTSDFTLELAVLPG